MMRCNAKYLKYLINLRKMQGIEKNIHETVSLFINSLFGGAFRPVQWNAYYN